MLASYIKPKPQWWKYIPWLSDFTANAIYPNIYLPEKIYINLNSKNPKSKYKVILIHEQTHLERERKMGWIKFGMKYLFLPQFRFEEEIIAIKAAMEYQKKNNLKLDLEKKAKYLSSWLYLWPVSYEKALKQLKKTWEVIK